LEAPPVNFVFNDTVLSDASAGVRKLHTVLLLNAVPADVEEANIELQQSEALVSSLFSRSYLLNKFKAKDEPARERLSLLNTACARLVRGGLVDHAWQLLVDASSEIQGFGTFNDEIILRLATLAPKLIPQSPAILDPVSLLSQEWLDSSVYFTTGKFTIDQFNRSLII